MASQTVHQRKADHNGDFLRGISQERFCDWAVVVAFYRAVHLVEALFAKSGINSNSHADRNSRLKTRHPKIWRDFHPLYNASIAARYDEFKMTPQDIECDLIGQRLLAVEQSIRSEWVSGQ